eukprot:scaffold17095_cov70-Skeletonema_marinoi.AAC.1
MSTRVTSGTNTFCLGAAGSTCPRFVSEDAHLKSKKRAESNPKHQNAFQLCGVYLFIGVGLLL